MRILWITNIMLPPVCEALELPVPSIGGWMYSSLKRLKKAGIGVIAVATVYSGKKLIEIQIDDVTYYLLPLNGKSAIKYNKHLEPLWFSIKESFKPDIVHIHGSEYPHGLAYVRSCGTGGVVVSIQGILSSYARYYSAGINYKNIKRYLTFRDFVKFDNILKGQRTFERRGILEKELLQSVKHIIGRTDWDHAHTWAINPQALYHFCGETLRDSFYNHRWEYDKCEVHTIFVSQSNYPIKGLHMLLEAMPLILRHYPDTQIYVAGGDPTNLPWWRITGYGKYLRRLIDKYNLRNNITFTGMLSEEPMCQRYLKSNLFLCCSSIENSPNSLGEAQLLGMPCVASFSGGIPEIVDYNTNVLYRFEETEMLANKVCEVFAKGYNSQESFNVDRYDPKLNLVTLLNIYESIYQKNNC